MQITHLDLFNARDDQLLRLGIHGNTNIVIKLFIRSAVANSSTSISLTWSVPLQPNGLITHYTINYIPINSISGLNYVNDSTINTTASPYNDTEITIGGLLKATSYSFTLTAYTVVGPSPPANDICYQYTLQDSKSPPLSLSLSLPLSSLSLLLIYYF